jgi:hypothetical protein
VTVGVEGRPRRQGRPVHEEDDLRVPVASDFTFRRLGPDREQDTRVLGGDEVVAHHHGRIGATSDESGERQVSPDRAADGQGGIGGADGPRRGPSGRWGVGIDTILAISRSGERGERGMGLAPPHRAVGRRSGLPAGLENSGRDDAPAAVLARLGMAENLVRQ